MHRPTTPPSRILTPFIAAAPPTRALLSSLALLAAPWSCAWAQAIAEDGTVPVADHPPASDTASTGTAAEGATPAGEAMPPPPAQPTVAPNDQKAEASPPTAPTAPTPPVPPRVLIDTAMLKQAAGTAAAAFTAAGGAHTPIPLGQPATSPTEPAVAAVEPEPTWSGDISTTVARSRTSYTSYLFSAALDLTYKLPGREVLTEARIDRENVNIPGSRETSVSTDEYDLSIKWKLFRPGSRTYLYGSPRLRHNRFSYYENSQAIRVGVGRRLYSDEPLTLDLELGSGYRWAQPASGFAVNQTLTTITTRFDYAYSSSLSMRLNYSSEKAGLERYNTLVASLNTPLVGALALKYEMSYRKIFPIDSGHLTTETNYNLALAYRI